MEKLTNKKIINTTYGKVTKEKGITLIALVITIIVLLILAGVSIAMLTGENGILTQAQNAKSETIKNGEKEQLRLAYMEAKAEKLKVGDTGAVTADELKKQVENDGVDATVTPETSPIEVEFNDTHNKYTVDGETGEITESTTPQTPGKPSYDPEKLTIGTEQEAKNTDKYGWKVGNYTKTTEEFTSGVWRLFFQDSQYAYLITDELVGSYRPSDYYDKEEDKEKYKDGTKMSIEGQKLNEKVSSLFTNESNKANTGIRATVWFTDTTEDGPWAKYKNSDCVFAIASPTAELFEASYNNNTNTTHKNYENNKINVQLGTFGYSENTSSNWLKAEDSHGIYNKDNSSYWWLASPGYNYGNSCLIVGGDNRLFLQPQREQLHECGSPYSLYSNIYIR